MSAKDVAQFMAQQFDDRDFVYQDQIVNAIVERFGEEYLYRNKNGNRAISSEVLAIFRKLTPDVVWERGQRVWRKRASYDKPGGRGVD